MIPAQSRYASTNGYRTHYIEEGSGQPVILIHGGGAGADCRGNWHAALPIFARHMRAIAYDMVGFGGSDTPDPATFKYTTDARVEQLIAFIKALGLGPVTLVGNSMGGSASLGVAMRHPELVKTLVLMGSAGLNRAITPALMPMVNYDFTLEGMKKIIAVLTHQGFTPNASLLPYRYELSIKPDVRRAYGATMAWVKEQGGLHYPESEIAKVTTRTLVFNGKDDLVVPVADAYKFLELIKPSHGYILPNCGHWAMIEHPETFARVSLDFIRSA